MASSHGQRRSLTHVGGSVRRTGDAAPAEKLSQALNVLPATDEGDDRARLDVHGFHTYPARMHPDTAARLLRDFAPRGGSVLDPFCGSATAVVEAMVQGHPAYGVDLNPLAVLLARSKTRPREPAELQALVERAAACAAHADDRRKARAGASRRFPIADTKLFEPHVLLELDSLRAYIETVPAGHLRDDLSLILSSVLVKFSIQRGDTSRAVAARRTAPGFPARFFARKAEEWATRLSALRQRLPQPVPPPAVIVLDDAASLQALPVKQVDAIITSPPYVATYDYLEHHELRLRWLGLDTSRLAKKEFGSRSAYRHLKPGEARNAWARELTAFLRAAGRLLPADGPLVLLMADSAVGSEALRADEIVSEFARECGFVPIACATQSRPHFHGPTQAAFRTRPRGEHAILLRKK
jgi:hypothetical protein